ncbi:MAG TPA: rod shape-determining protein MreC, partial [Desulfomonilia bacterium]|nr:rod shape-determining protein MreC [Desulfomonilia bacterium]
MEHGSTHKIIIIAVALAVVIVLLSLGQHRSLSFGLNPLREGFFIGEKIATTPFRFVYDLWTDYVALVNTRSENKELKKRFEQSQVQCMTMQELKSENERLSSMLGFKNEHKDFNLFPARLLAQDISLIFKTVMIDRGRTQGFFSGMLVVSPLGLVGRVISVSPHTSQVLLVTDPNSAMPALIEENRVKGIIKGTGTNMLSLEYVRNTELVQVGNMVVTSGLEGIFPKGIRIGRIADIRRDPH